MATGKKAFEGKSRASVIAAIMQTEPTPMTSIEAMSPARALKNVPRRKLECLRFVLLS
jgi:hypothetical protein